MRALIISILVMFLLTAGCVNAPANTTNTENNSTDNTPTTSIPQETTNPGVIDNGNTNEGTTPVETTPAPEVTTYTLADVAAHNQTSDCWTAIQGKVYDITKYIPNHPGGSVILQACGKDGTTLFETRNGNGPHPLQAAQTLSKYYVGESS